MLMYTECIVPEDGHRNKDGYIRVLNKPRKDGGRLMMLHRLEWEKSNGTIPDGYEINHKCKNRECCNLNHLELLSCREHRIKDNAQRFKSREDEVVAFMMKNPHIYQKDVGFLFGLPQSSISRIKIRRIDNGA